MTKTIFISTHGNGVEKVEIPCIWKGENLAVHKAWKKDQKPGQRTRKYTITHIKTGMSCGFVGRYKKVSLYDLIAFAGKWDERFTFSTEKEVYDWKFRDQYRKERFELTGYFT